MNAVHDFGFTSIEDARQQLTRCDSYSRLPTLLNMWMNEADWLQLLGEEWSSCDNIGHHIDELFNSPMWMSDHAGPAVKRVMMTTEEQAAYDALPEIVTVYRGCYAQNKWGFSWSLSKDTAERFPMLNRYKQHGQALLVTSQVKKEKIVAVKLDRNECEIITFRPKHISTRHIKTAVAA